MSVAAELDAVAAELSSARPDVQVRIYDGELDAAGVQKLVLSPPSVLLSCVSSVPTPTAKDIPLGGARGPGGIHEGWEWTHEAEFVAAVLAKGKAGERHRDAWGVVDTMLPTLFRKAARGIRVANSFSSTLWAKGLYLLAVGWTRRIKVESAAMERFAPSAVRVDDGRDAHKEWPRDD